MAQQLAAVAVRQVYILVILPNKETVAAMQEIKQGKGKRFDSVDALFKGV
ncbi:hypothetical protein GCM10007415_09650 [Parapedobacter pyrenivorans]|uniref:Uncharacterized protein n=1 Tax=Parapedobacter pyrenivorans TaxID=1305674 RepID=A0A917M607_9SPHI|nr:hypothetical protein [Parapedobacter pyrenivorans]GGG79512.1 hypothetical protein GCM10007415_09650 [Parapedobacter pyrenivorans]